jgi:hypothetical protein
MVLHPVTGGRIVTEIYTMAGWNGLYAWQKRNAANAMIDQARALLDDDSELTDRWDEMLDGKWEHMLDRKFTSDAPRPLRNVLTTWQRLTLAMMDTGNNPCATASRL